MKKDFFSSDQPAAGEAGAEPASIIPANLIGANDLVTLELAERALGALRGWEIKIGTAVTPDKPGPDYLRDVHYHLMQDIYAEAGGTRGDMLDRARAEGDPAAAQLIAGSRTGAEGQVLILLPAAEVNERLDTLAGLLEKENYLRGLTRPEFLSRVADYYVDYAQAAPFPTGNAAVLQTVFDQVGQRAGYEVDLARAPRLEQVTDAVLAAGIHSDKRELRAVLSEAITEAPGPEAALARRATLQVLQPEVPPQMQAKQFTEEATQAAASINGRVGGQDLPAFRASVRAISSGDVAPEHLNTLRTTARRWSPEHPGDVARVERVVGQLDALRLGEQQLSRTRDFQAAQRGPESSRKVAEIAQ